MGLQVQPPCRLALAPAVHGHGDEIRPILEVADHDAAFEAGPPADSVEAHGAPAVRLRPPQPHTSAGQTVQTAMGEPETPYEPATKRSWLGIRDGHVCSFVTSW